VTGNRRDPGAAGAKSNPVTGYPQLQYNSKFGGSYFWPPKSDAGVRRIPVANWVANDAALGGARPGPR
jgi:hypothetical protein